MSAPRRSCRLCGFDGIETVVSLSRMPRWNHRLLAEHEVLADEGIDVAVEQCPSCGFVSVPMNLSDDYYDDYVNVPSLSAQARRFQSEQAQAFVSRFDLAGRRVLEIGCGDGFFLDALRQAGAECRGVEPSAAQAEIARARGLDVEQAVLCDGRVLDDAPFDAFATRQVFEHVSDLRDFLLTIRANLRPNAVGLVEVPNLEKLLGEARFFDFIPEHINYFDSKTLGLALQLAGFQVLEVVPVDGGESLRALVRWQPLAGCAPIAERVASLRADMAAFMAECRSRGRKVALWGAGGKGLSMMAVADLAGIEMLVDGDPGKLGLYTPVSHLRVSSPEQLAGRSIDDVIVMAPAYENEIAAALRSEFRFTGRIVLAGRGFRILD